RRRHTISKRDWSSDVCSSDLSTFSKNFTVLFIGGSIYKLLCTSIPSVNNVIVIFPSFPYQSASNSYSATPSEENSVNPSISLIQIGRASCRERGSVSVHAVAV